MRDFRCHIKEGLDKETRQACRAACEEFHEYKDSGYCVLHFPGEDKRTDFEEAKQSKLAQQNYDFSCTVFPEGTSDFEGLEFEDATFHEATFVGNADFRGAKFRGEMTNFRGAKFCGEMTNFSHAEFFSPHINFSLALFRGKTNFHVATFYSQPDFHDSTLRDTTFENAYFEHGADFTRATFFGTRAISNGVRKRTTDFRRATFGGELYFRGAEFKGFTDFYRAIFLDAVKFIGGEKVEVEEVVEGEVEEVEVKVKYPTPILVFAPEGQVSFKRARIEKPELFSFDTIKLRPSWFVGVDARKFDFTAVDWDGLLKGFADTFDREIKGIREKGEPGSPYDSLAQACRRLSANTEENREYPLANEFHYWSMDALRLGSWTVLYEALLKEKVRQDIKEKEQRDTRFKDLKPDALDVRALLRKDTRQRIRGRRRFGLINSLYWALSGYGVRPGRALGALLTIAGVFAVLYMIEGHHSLQVLSIMGFWQILADAWQAVMYSLGVMSRLRPEPIPKGIGFFQILVTIEGILGPLQIALLVLAIRRKVMR
jgi:uncharacterized protein YjbI with pentapeptide repeats